MISLINKLIKNDLIEDTAMVPTGKYSTMTTNLQDANNSEIVFYNIPEGQIAEDLFLTRYQNSKAGLVVVNRYFKGLENLENIIICKKNCFQKTKEELMDYFYPPKKSSLKVIGVTGTNGKTTVAYLTMQLGKMAGLNSLYIGTIGVFYNNNKVEDFTENTTPSEIYLRKILNRYPNKIDLLILEMSSHALDQSRLGNLSLDAGAFISFTQDHLDYHKTMEQYLGAKLQLFSLCKTKIIVPKNQKFVPVSYPTEEVLFLSEYKFKSIPARFQVAFNQLNLEISLKLINKIVPTFKIDQIDSLRLPKGRFDEIAYNDKVVIIDYAHTPDALEKLLSEVKRVYRDLDLWVVFGCGGDRDKRKRPLMGQVVDKYADFLVVTSDNPRTEDPNKIIDEIKAGISSNKFHGIADRKRAINYSLNMSTKNAVIVIAGKGHEEYQEINGVKRPFSDFNIVKNILKES